MIAGDAIHRRFDCLNQLQRFGQELRVFNDVPGETDEFGREFVDLVNDGLQIGAVALVMHVCELNETVGGFARGGAHGADLDPFRFDRKRVGEGEQRCRPDGMAQETTAIHFGRLPVRCWHKIKN